jgi:hypothetical protein
MQIVDGGSSNDIIAAWDSPEMHEFEVRIGIGHMEHVEAASWCAGKAESRVSCKAYPGTAE